MRRTISALSDIDDDRVPDIARRMIARDVEQIEVVTAGFDLRAEDGLKPHQREDLAELVDHLADRVGVADRRAATGKRHVDRVGCESLRQLGGGERGLP